MLRAALGDLPVKNLFDFADNFRRVLQPPGEAGKQDWRMVVVDDDLKLRTGRQPPQALLSMPHKRSARHRSCSCSPTHREHTRCVYRQLPLEKGTRRRLRSLRHRFDGSFRSGSVFAGGHADTGFKRIIQRRHDGCDDILFGLAGRKRLPSRLVRFVSTKDASPLSISATVKEINWHCGAGRLSPAWRPADEGQSENGETM